MPNSIPSADKKQSANAELKQLAASANKEHFAGQKAAQSFIEHARSCGDYLIKGKQIVGHGSFEDWVAKNCKFSIQQARRYMRIAEGWDKLLSLSNR